MRSEEEHIQWFKSTPHDQFHGVKCKPLFKQKNYKWSLVVKILLKITSSKSRGFYFKINQIRKDNDTYFNFKNEKQYFHNLHKKR